MVREKLEQLGNEKRHRFTATVERFGEKSAWRSFERIKTILLVDVKLKGSKKIITDHLWFTCGKQFEKLDLKQGDIIEFNARVGDYIKINRDYRAFEVDYKLEYPTSIEVIYRANDSVA